ncbi:beta-N-acetylhexosaminidase [Methylocaldum szegediense]|uniref:Beta-hexosaminidase n=1 Tax=Methylocaldum szegediense TaxID=73780 RepID=A0ABM9HVM3_9GAMM|nr:beta-N-acetylhexosaminidase [Methylocaldum szegediense]CAI8716382.1 beta-N-acetylhexosaminidase [Methylocaldum szegediense]
MKSVKPLGPVMLDLRGPSLSPDEKDKLTHPATGGLILFSRNYESPDQLMNLVAEIRALRPDILIAVDHEGGRVQRFREGFTRLPPASRYRERSNGQLETAETMAETAGWLMAAELRAADIDFSFAPVLDVDCGISDIIGNRSFSRDPLEAATLARAFARGMRRAGMAAVGKHFPGHGGVAEDSHLALPIDRRPLAEIEARDLQPFRILIEFGLEGVMPAHVVFENVDKRPAGFSPFWIRDVLRHRLGFDGAVFSDDLSMAGAAFAGNHVDRARLALEAGCDMVLVCNMPDAAEEVLESLENHANTESESRLRRMRGRFPLDRNALLSSEDWGRAVELIASINEQPGYA